MSDIKSRARYVNSTRYVEVLLTYFEQYEVERDVNSTRYVEVLLTYFEVRQ